MSSALITGLLPWHNSAWQQAQTQLEAGQFSHATLISAGADTGKRHFALMLAQRILCRSPQQGFACGACVSCKLNAAGNNPDLMLVAPEEKSKIIKVDQIRELKKYIETTSHALGKRIIVLDTAEHLNVNGANALLKSLEEPPADVVFLLLSDRPRSVLATISSRCVSLKLPAPDKQQALDWLQAQLPQSKGERLEYALDYTQGRPMAALAALSSDQDSEQEQFGVALLKTLRHEELATRTAGRYYKTHAGELLETLAYWLSSLAKFQVTGNRHLLKGDSLHQAANLLNTANPDSGRQARRLLQLYEQVSQAQTQLAGGGNPNMQLLLEDLLLQLQSLSGKELQA
ncbi:MAG: DNA polymerase III subunit delta' [Pseudomonadales bacterium]|nr:DNA polymerase III subunit delta' [Pseudomonadales bacterium]